MPRLRLRWPRLHPVLFTGLEKALLVLHALSAMALLGALTHLVVVKALRWRGQARERLEQKYSRLIAPIYAGVYGIGLALYPHFRVNIRGRLLDVEHPWASNLFDFKEHLASLGLPMAMALFFLARGGPPVRPLTDLFAFALWAMTLWSVVSGLIITSVKGI